MKSMAKDYILFLNQSNKEMRTLSLTAVPLTKKNQKNKAKRTPPPKKKIQPKITNKKPKINFNVNIFL